MRRIGWGCAAALLLGAASPAAAERWYRVSRADTSVTYVDADSISEEAGNRYAITYSVYATPVSGRIYAGTIRSEYVCKDNYFRTLEYSYYGRANEHLGTEPSETIDERKVPEPGSINESIFRFVCDGTGGTQVANPWQDGRAIFPLGK